MLSIIFTLATLSPLLNLATLEAIRVRDWADEVRTLGELSAHETVVVNVWATWCPPCRQELPWLLAYHETGRIQLLAVNLGDSHGAVARFLAEEELELLPVYFASHRELLPLRLPGLPTTYVVREGEVASVHYGPLSPGDLAALFEEE